jgi:hypothetical protein
LVKKSFPDAGYEPEVKAGWYSINIPIRQGNYNLWVNYDCKYMAVGVPLGDARTEKALAEKTSGLTGDSGTSYGTLFWVNKKNLAYPALSDAQFQPLANTGGAVA